MSHAWTHLRSLSASIMKGAVDVEVHSKGNSIWKRGLACSSIENPARRIVIGHELDGSNWSRASLAKRRSSRAACL
jgi:hypothetical protein